MSLTDLQKKGVMETLLLLLKKKKASRKDLRENVDAVLETLYKTTLPTLKKLELIGETTNRRFPFTVEIFLTEKGRKVAEKVKELDELL